MSTNKHTPLAFGAALTADVLNAPLSELDAAIGVIEGGLAGSSLAVTTTDATANAGQPVVPVTATDGFIVGQSVYIGDVAGTFETKVIASIQAGVSLTMTANLANTYAAGKVVSASPSELVHARGASPTLDARLDAFEAATNAAIADLPLGQIGYAEVTANQAGIGGEVDLTGLSVAINAGATNRRLRISCAMLVNSSLTDDTAAIYIKEGATYLQTGRMRARASQETIFVSVVRTVTGAHTYKLAAQSLGGGSVTVLAAAATPAYILVEDLGAA